jgi:hypothetical protein
MKRLAKFTAAASLVSAAAITASVLPASAAPELQLFGTSGNQYIICTPPGTHGIQTGQLLGMTGVTNGCNTRAWFHEFSNGSGWSYCVSPRSAVLVPAWAEFPQQVLVSQNTAAC